MKTKIKSYGKRQDSVMQTWLNLIRSFNIIRASEASYVQSHNITFGQFEVLEALYHRGDLTTGELTKLIGSTPGNVTVVIKNLQKQHFISNQRSPHDGRIFINTITAKGRSLISTMFDQHVSNLTQNFEPLDDEELQQLSTLLRKLYKHNHQKRA